jgi:hypothetical protein
MRHSSRSSSSDLRLQLGADARQVLADGENVSVVHALNIGQHLFAPRNLLFQLLAAQPQRRQLRLRQRHQPQQIAILFRDCRSLGGIGEAVLRR